MTEVLRLHALLPASRANGPGLRAVLWLQGCRLACPGCFNPETHDPLGGREWGVSGLVATLRALPGIDGLTISGGEPFDQAAGLLSLLEGLVDSDLGVVLFSGYRHREILRMARGPAILARIDALIDGRYVATRHLGRDLRGSSNQRLRLFGDRYRAADFDGLPEAELQIAPNGELAISGVAPPRVLSSQPDSL